MHSASFFVSRRAHLRSRSTTFSRNVGYSGDNADEHGCRTDRTERNARLGRVIHHLYRRRVLDKVENVTERTAQRVTPSHPAFGCKRGLGGTICASVNRNRHPDISICEKPFVGCFPVCGGDCCCWCCWRAPRWW